MAIRDSPVVPVGRVVQPVLSARAKQLRRVVQPGAVGSPVHRDVSGDSGADAAGVTVTRWAVP